MSATRIAFVVVVFVFESGCGTELLAFDSRTSNGGHGGSSAASGGSSNAGAGAGGGASGGKGAASGAGGAGTTAGSGGGAGSAPNGTITRVTVSNDGTEANAGTLGAALSGDGRFVAFSTLAENLVPDDTNEDADVFVRDLASGVLSCMSRRPDGGSANGASTSPSLSRDGRELAFASLASDLGASGVRDEYVLLHRALDMPALDTVRAPQTDCIGGATVNGGREFVFCTANALIPEDANPIADVYVRASDGTLELVSRSLTGAAGNGRSVLPVVSADGNVVVFESDASDLVPSDTNDNTDIFAYDRTRAELVRVSVDSDGSEADGTSTGASVSADGLRIAFASSAANLVPNDANAVRDVFVHDRVTGETVRASVGNGDAEAASDSYGPSLDGAGRVVAFTSFAENLDAECSKPTGVFVRDLSTSLTFCVSRVDAPSLADGSSDPVISDDARIVVFSSYAPTLVAADTNLAPDVFVYRFTTAPWL